MPDAAHPQVPPAPSPPQQSPPEQPRPEQPRPEQRSAQPALVEALGGKRGLLDSGLPAVVFVFVNSVVTALAGRETALRAALVAAVLCGVGIVVLRIARKETLQQAVSGFIGLGLAVFFAARSGEARGFFLPGIWINVVYGLVFLVSALVGRPLVGAIYAGFEGTGSAWRQDARLRRVYALASVFWGLVFGSRAAVQGTLYVLDRPGLLAAARLLMGWPLTIAAVALTIALVKRARARVDLAPQADGATAGAAAARDR